RGAEEEGEAKSGAEEEGSEEGCPQEEGCKEEEGCPQEEGRQAQARQEKGSEAQGSEEEGRPKAEGRQAQARQEEGGEAQGCEKEGCPEEIGLRGNPSVAAAMDPKTGDAQVSPVLFGRGESPDSGVSGEPPMPCRWHCLPAFRRRARLQSHPCDSCRRAWTCLRRVRHRRSRAVAAHASPCP